MIETAVASYRVTVRPGQGGMGEVYRATDTQLGRDVAIKVLPESMAGDPERLARSANIRNGRRDVSSRKFAA